MIMAVNKTLCVISMEYAADTLATKEKIKMRKPVVEKMRRDRINSSINQLRKLLEQEFQLLQPDSKPEKADVLETAVQFLRQQQICNHQGMKSVHRTDHQQYRHGYSKCLHEALSYLSAHHTGQETQVKLLNHFHQLESQPRNLSCLLSPPKSISERANQQEQPLIANTKYLWRPWQKI
ncbi:transcription factor HES-5-like [Bufo bufo]|uniref:transcription factor HES-5-like n=1 Tax=Bufo bufo TaxID=8384 RepID=UPI001ABE9C7B|nr:transcription factor HES-5-like [Bufo bufo]